MSRIQQIMPLYGEQKKSKSVSTDFVTGINFGRKSVIDVDKAVDVFEKGTLGKLSWISNKLAVNDSEIQTQLINGLFTGTLAPVMIGFNPISKSDEKTKKYSALRQPISAVIAVAGGVLLTSPINDYLGNLISEGHLPAIDLRMSPMKSHIMPQFNAEEKKATDKKAFWESLSPKDYQDEKFKPNGAPTGAYKKACIDNYIKAVQEKRQTLFTHLLSEDPKAIDIDEATSKITLKGTVIGENVPNLKTKPALIKYLDENNFHNIKFGEFMRQNFKLEVYPDHTPKPANLDYKLKTIKAMEFLKQIGFLGGGISFSEHELREKVLKSQQKELSVEMDGIVDKTKIEKLLAVTGKQANVTGQTIVGESPNDVHSLTLNQLLHRYDYVDDAEKGGIKKFEALLKKSVKGAIAEFSSPELLGSILAKENGVKKELHNIDFKAFSKNIVKNMVAKNESNAKQFVKYGGIVANLGIVYLTCSILNWVFPRFVDMFFPSLSKSDPPENSVETDKGGNK